MKWSWSREPGYLVWAAGVVERVSSLGISTRRVIAEPERSLFVGLFERDGGVLDAGLYYVDPGRSFLGFRRMAVELVWPVALPPDFSAFRYIGEGRGAHDRP